METTLRAFENVTVLMVGDKLSHKIGMRKQWDADFVLHLLGFIACLEENSFNQMSQDQRRPCSVHGSFAMRMGKAFSAHLRHDHRLAREMAPRGAVPMNLVLDG